MLEVRTRCQVVKGGNRHGFGLLLLLLLLVLLLLMLLKRIGLVGVNGGQIHTVMVVAGKPTVWGGEVVVGIAFVLVVVLFLLGRVVVKQVGHHILVDRNVTSLLIIEFTFIFIFIFIFIYFSIAILLIIGEGVNFEVVIIIVIVVFVCVVEIIHHE